MKKVMSGDGATRFSTLHGKPIFHFLNTSTFTEYTVVDSPCVVKIHVHGHRIHAYLNPYIKTLTLLSCGVSTGGVDVGRGPNTEDGWHLGSVPTATWQSRKAGGSKINTFYD
ncbi:hypothetical protein Fmac_012205 [Flemingia macrophylla]|uniref:Uncharacterized protein n=1 Tax=Flemingia macrophylla TaxID=520843 RepID=A0ABD1MPN8_9FABA